MNPPKKRSLNLQPRLKDIGIQLAIELVHKEIANLFNQGGIRMITLKGPHVGSILYDDPAERPYGDLDLLVRLSQFDAAEKILARAGYKPRQPQEGRAATVRNFYNQAWFSLLGVCVELHRNLTGYGRYMLDIDGMFERAIQFRMGNVTALGLSNQDLLLHLCIHILNDYFAYCGEKHLKDISLLIKKRSINWREFCSMASKAGCTTGSYYVLRVARDLHGCYIPDEVFAQLRPGPVRRFWIERSLDLRTFPSYRYRSKSLIETQLRLGLPLIDRPIDWVSILLRYSKIRFKDSLYAIL